MKIVNTLERGVVKIALSISNKDKYIAMSHAKVAGLRFLPQGKAQQAECIKELFLFLTVLLHSFYTKQLKEVFSAMTNTNNHQSGRSIFSSQSDTRFEQHFFNANACSGSSGRQHPVSHRRDSSSPARCRRSRHLA